MQPTAYRWSVAIACGGTGGHLFPGFAVAEVLARRNCALQLFVSRKEIDRQPVPAGLSAEIARLDAVGFQPKRPLTFLRGLWQSRREVGRCFRRSPPHAVLAMGGFTSAAPIWAGRRCGAATFLHESNSAPGRANRWLAPWVHAVFVGFPGACQRLRNRRLLVTGTPVRSEFRAIDRAASRRALGLDPGRPVLLITGGSQGAGALNRLLVEALPPLAGEFPDLQYVHLTGTRDCDQVRDAYARLDRRAFVAAFLEHMEMALGAASLTLSRAGASSLAESAAVRVPAILVPYPAAADDHQWHNARAFAESGAAVMFEQNAITSTILAETVKRLLQDPSAQDKMRTALARWDSPQAAETIASSMLEELSQRDARSGALKQNPVTTKSGFVTCGSKGGP